MDKREPRGTFLSLGLFISRPRPTASASKMRPRLQKTFPRFPFFNLGNFGQTSNQTWTNLSSDVVSTIIETKYYYYTNNVRCFVLCPNALKMGISKLDKRLTDIIQTSGLFIISSFKITSSLVPKFTLPFHSFVGNFFINQNNWKTVS